MQSCTLLGGYIPVLLQGVLAFRVVSHLCHGTKFVQKVTMACGQWNQHGRHHVTRR